MRKEHAGECIFLRKNIQGYNECLAGKPLFGQESVLQGFFNFILQTSSSSVIEVSIWYFGLSQTELAEPFKV